MTVVKDISGQKYVPPHVRNKKRHNTNNRKNKNKKEKEEIKLDTSCENFPELIDKSFIQEENNNWIKESKSVPMYSKDSCKVNEYFDIGNMTFKFDEEVDEGFVILNRDKNLNRGNCEECECCTFKSIDREIELENYWNFVMNLSRNSEGIPLIPNKYTPFNYDTDDEELNEENEEDHYDECENLATDKVDMDDYESQSDPEDYY